MATNNANNTSNPITVAQGGIGRASLTSYGVLCGGTTSTGAIQSIGVGTAGAYLTSNGASALPSFQTASAGVILWDFVTATNSATLSLILEAPAVYNYSFVINSLIPATSGANLLINTSTNGGSSYDAGAGNYAWLQQGWTSLLNTNGGSNSDTSINIFTSASTTANIGVNGNIFITAANSANYCVINSSMTSYNSGGSYIGYNTMGYRLSATAVNAVQVSFSTGNIASGTIGVYAYPS